MSKLIIVQNDEVKGTDKHNVAGSADTKPPVAYTGIGEFIYIGKMRDQLSNFATISGRPIALKNSKSLLNPGEEVSPAGKHSGPMGKNFTPDSPAPILSTLKIIDQIGEGKPSAKSGSSFVKVNGVAILLDGDKIDTCDGSNVPMNSTVTAKNQDFVFCSE